MNVKLITHTENPDKLVASAAKLCYSDSDVDTLMENLTEDKIDQFIAKLAEYGHESPIEHVSFTFAIEGVSRAFLAQITRHRISSFSVQSQRYVSMAGDKEWFVIPPSIAKNELALKTYQSAINDTRESYFKLVNILSSTYMDDSKFTKDYPDEASARKAAEKKSLEDARFILPNACHTRMIVTMNARSLMNFFNLRCCNRAQWEIRSAATMMLRLCYEVSPNLFKYAGPKCLKGKCPEGHMCCGRTLEVRNYFASLKEGSNYETHCGN